MNIIFIDPIDFDYDVGTPFTQPLGGSQSALCYLAVQLAARGHHVTVYASMPSPVVVRGVTCRPNRDIQREHLQQPADAIVLLNGPVDLAITIRQHLTARTPLLLWTQHAPNEQAMDGLRDPALRKLWDGIVCISTWHREAMLRAFDLDPARVALVPNAIGPFFSRLFSSADELRAAKSGPPVLAYTSTPFRGLDVLLAAFPAIRRHHPDAQLRVYSSMAVYRSPETGYQALYDALRSTAGVTYVGSLPQAELAAALREASVLAYPNTFPETYCIAAAEALAAGLHVVTSDLGALPETTGGFATLVPGAAASPNRMEFVHAFVDATCHALAQRASAPDRFAAARFAQVQATLAHCQWAERAAQWERLLSGDSTRLIETGFVQ